MARIRSIKPTFWTSQTLAKVSRETRLTFAGLFNEADDAGRLADAPKRLAGALFPFDDDIDAAWMQDRLVELAKVGAIVRYVVDGARFIAIPGFDRHQVINRPTPSTIPPPGALTEDSVSAHGVLTEDSVTEGKGREGKGMEGKPDAPPAHEPVNRGRQNPDAPPPLAGVLMPKRIGMGGVGFMENPADAPQTVEALLDQHGAELAKAFPMLDGKTPRPTIETAVRTKWGWYLTARAKVGGGHRNAFESLKVDLGKIAREHTFSWERDRGTTTESKAVANTKTKVLAAHNAPAPVDDPETRAAADAALAAMRNIGKPASERTKPKERPP